DVNCPAARDDFLRSGGTQWVATDSPEHLLDPFATQRKTVRDRVGNACTPFQDIFFREDVIEKVALELVNPSAEYSFRITRDIEETARGIQGPITSRTLLDKRSLYPIG